MKTFKCWAWNRTVKIGEVTVTAVTSYEAQKRAARQLGVRAMRVNVHEILTERKDLFVAI